MKKRMLALVLLPVLVFALAGVAQAWQGRMAGMGDPFGLVQDESDFLIHPAKIAKGEGVRFYGDYRFTYTDVMDWGYDLDVFNTAGTLAGFYHYDGSGQEYKHNALLGAAFPLGPGRMGLFFTYDGMRGNYDGNEDVLGLSNFAEYDLTKNLDNLALKFLYGFPVLGMNAGVELGAVYRNEEEKWWIPDTKNDVWPSDYHQNLHYFMNPYDSQYWEILWKAGVGRKFSAASFDWTVRGGSIISSNNKYEYSYAGTSEHVVMDGDVSGFRIGTDLWFRYQMNDALTLPFVVSVDYASKHRDGDGIGTGIIDIGHRYTYEHQERTFEAKVGGGVEKKINTGGLISAALYYHYLQRQEHQWFNNQDWSYLYDYVDFPLHKEHRLEMNFAGELELSPSVTMRMGLNPFYGWVVAHDFKQSSVGIFTDDISSDGYAWGINASLGGTVKFSRFALEPFINGGYRSLRVEGDGDQTDGTGLTTGFRNFDQNRSEWFVGGGFSILFDL